MRPMDLRPLHRAAALGLLAALGLGGVAGCSSATDSAPRTAEVRKSAPGVSPAPSGTAPATPTDVGWVQLMTPMNQQAVKLLTLAAERAAEPRVRAFAVRLRTGHEAELNRLRPLLTRMGLPLTDVHAGHDMPGMVTEQDLEAAHAAEDPRSTGSSSRGSGTICASPRRCRVPRSPRAAGRTPVNWRAPS